MVSPSISEAQKGQRPHASARPHKTHPQPVGEGLEGVFLRFVKDMMICVRDCVSRRTTGCQFNLPRSRQESATTPTHRRAVGGGARDDEEAGDRRHHDDPALHGAEHGQPLLRQAEDALNVDVEDGLHVRQGEVLHAGHLFLAKGGLGFGVGGTAPPRRAKKNRQPPRQTHTTDGP